VKEKLRVAAIGAGSSGAGHLVMLERFEPGCVVAFCDLDRTLFDRIIDGYLGRGASKEAGDFATDATALRESIRDIPFYTDPEEMFAKEDINTVVIATYCSAHAEMIEKCVKHGMHILVEKPIAITEEQVEKCWELLKDYPKVATVNFTMRPAPVSIAARDHVRSGAIGKIVSAQYIYNVHGSGFFRKWMRTREKIGSLLLQKATHDFDIMNSIIGLRPVRIAAFGSRLVYGGDMPNELTCDECDRKWSCPMSIYRRQLETAKVLPPKSCRKCVYAREIDIDDNQVVIIQYEGGVTASYCQTFNAPPGGVQRGGYFVGNEGIMHLKYYGEFVESPATGQTLIGNSTIDITNIHQKAGTRIHEVYDWGGHAHYDGTEYGILEKIKLIRGGTSDVAGTVEEGYISAKMCLAAQESIETGKVVKLNLSC